MSGLCNGCAGHRRYAHPLLRCTRPVAFALALVFAFVPASARFAANAASVTGTFTEPGVVWLSDGSKPEAVKNVVMINRQKAFVPDVVVVTAGSSVRFPNDDPFFHSVYSASLADPFDIGFYDTGSGKVIEFPAPGVLDVRCHIHARMHGTIVVVDGPYAQAAAAGTFTLTNVLPGNHELHVWTHNGAVRSQRLKVPPGDATVVVRKL